jgi:hypothetical protein
MQGTYDRGKFVTDNVQGYGKILMNGVIAGPAASRH